MSKIFYPIGILLESIVTIVVTMIAATMFLVPLATVFLLTVYYSAELMMPNHMVGEWHYLGEARDMEECCTRLAVDIPLDQSEHSIVFGHREILINDIEYKVKHYDFLDGRHGPQRVVVMLDSGEGLFFQFNGHNQLDWKNGPWEGLLQRGTADQ